MSTNEAQNLDIVERFYRHFSEGALDSLGDLLADDIVYHFHPSDEIPFSGSRTDKSSFMAFLAEVDEHLLVERFEPQEFSVAGDKVFVKGHETAKVRKTGKHFESDWFFVFSVANQRIQSIRDYSDTHVIAKAFAE